MMGAVYENVIVPNDGSLGGRMVFAPAADLAWKCRARVVNVANTDVNDKASKAAVKQYAMSQTDRDVEYWVDLKRPLATATLIAASYRTGCIICVASPPPPPKIIGRRRLSVSPLVLELARRSEVPVVVIGPATETGQGMPMNELVVVLDGSPESDDVLGPAMEWATTFRLRMVLVAVARPGKAHDLSAMQQYLDARAGSLSAPVGVGFELLPGEAGVADLATVLSAHESAVVMVATGPTGTALDGQTEELLRLSPRAVVLVRT
jgi:hypothetical protein